MDKETSSANISIPNKPDDNIQEQTSLSPKYTTLDSPDCGDAINIDKTSSDQQAIIPPTSITFATQNNITDSIIDDKVSSCMGASSATNQPPVDTTSSIMQQQQQTTFNIRSSRTTSSLNIQQHIANERFQQQQQQMLVGASSGIAKQQHIVRPLMQQHQQRIPITHNPLTNILPKANLMYHAVPYYALPPHHPHQFAMPTAASHHVAAAIKFASYQQASFHHQAKLNSSTMTVQAPPQQPIEFSSFVTHPSMATTNQHLSSYQEDATKHCTKERMRRYA